MSGIGRLARLQDVSTEIANLDARAADGRDSATAAFEGMYGDNRVAVLKFLTVFVGDEDKAVELASMTFERAWMEYRRGHRIGLGWLLRTARNAAVDSSRREAVRDRIKRMHVGRPFVASAEDVVILRSSQSAIRDAVARLQWPQRDAIVLRFTTGLPVREIAVVIGKTESATEKLISRAIEKLREDLHDDV